MPILRGGAFLSAPTTYGGLEVATGTPPIGGWASDMGDPSTYAQIYATQPNVRTVIDFLARNIAQLGIHVFRRVSDTDRVRLTDHPMAQWLAAPTPYTTRYRQIENLMGDLGIYFNAYWLKLRETTGRVHLQRLPPGEMQVVGGLTPQAFIWTTAKGALYELSPLDVVHFNGYNPLNALTGLSPLETLRRLLAEDAAATGHRAALWRNASRIDGVIERPLAAKVWNPTQLESFRDQWRTKFSGEGSVGAAPVLQEGMTFKAVSFSPRQTEYVASRKLTREEVAAAYHVPLPMVGILDHATYSNVKEQHKQLYQDTLGPWIEMIALELMRQVLPEAEDVDRVYVEFNIAEKLSGSFEEQSGSLQTLVGVPIMTANEGRARLNLPAIKTPEADELVRPLNTAAVNAAPTPPAAGAGARVLPFAAGPNDDAIDVGPAIDAAWKRQAAVLAKIDPMFRADAFDDARWARELVADLIPIYRAAGHADAHATKRAERLAFIVNADTRTLLTAGVAAFSPHREASCYVP